MILEAIYNIGTRGSAECRIEYIREVLSECGYDGNPVVEHSVRLLLDDHHHGVWYDAQSFHEALTGLLDSFADRLHGTMDEGEWLRGLFGNDKY